MSDPFYTFAFTALELAALDWVELEAASKLSFTEPQRATLLAALNRFLEQVGYQYHRPSAKAVQRQLQTIERHARGLAAALGDASELGQAATYEALPSSVTDPAALIRLLHDLSLCARAAKESLRGKAGRPPNEALPTLIRAWHAVYLDAGGTGRGCGWNELCDPPQFTGPLLALLEMGLHQAACPLGDTPLAQTIRIPRNTLAQAIKDAF
jgi:hypothetical protein